MGIGCHVNGIDKTRLSFGMCCTKTTIIWLIASIRHYRHRHFRRWKLWKCDLMDISVDVNQVAEEREFRRNVRLRVGLLIFLIFSYDFASLRCLKISSVKSLEI